MYKSASDVVIYLLLFVFGFIAVNTFSFLFFFQLTEVRGGQQCTLAACTEELTKFLFKKTLLHPL